MSERHDQRAEAERLARVRALVRRGVPHGGGGVRRLRRVVAVGHGIAHGRGPGAAADASSARTLGGRAGRPVDRARAGAAGRCLRAARDPGDRRELHGRPGHELRGPEGRARPLPRHRRPWDDTGRVGIAGHRTTYQAPFFDLGSCGPATGSSSARSTARSGYEVDRVFVMPSAGSGRVLVQTPRPSLVLTTCNPKYSSAERLIVTARRVGA